MKFDVPLRMPWSDVTWLAAIDWAKAAMIGTPPATLASKATARPWVRAASNTCAPWRARSALFERPAGAGGEEVGALGEEPHDAAADGAAAEECDAQRFGHANCLATLRRSVLAGTLRRSVANRQVRQLNSYVCRSSACLSAARS